MPLTAGPADWRRGLRSKLTWWMLAKLGALALLWVLFFSHPPPASDPAHPLMPYMEAEPPP